MKRLLLVGVLLILFSIPVLAGEYLMNDTGETVYGLTVTFSEPVTITGFGDVLMTVEPIGESSSFTFSGGELEAWGGHWLNWELASAKLVRHDWLRNGTNQSTDSYSRDVWIHGIVKNAYGAPVETTVTVDALGLGDQGWYRTDSQGRFDVKVRAAPQYIVTASPQRTDWRGSYSFPQNYMPEKKLVIRDGTDSDVDFTVKAAGTLWLRAYDVSGKEMTLQDFPSTYWIGAFRPGVLPVGKSLQAENNSYPLYWGWIKNSSSNIACMMVPVREPASIWAMWKIPGAGTTFLHADNGGFGYSLQRGDIVTLNLVFEFARTELRQLNQRYKDFQVVGYTLPTDANEMLNTANALMEEARNAQDHQDWSGAAEKSYVILRNVIRAREKLELQKSDQDIAATRIRHTVVTLTDPEGMPLGGATVEVNQISHDFILSIGWPQHGQYSVFSQTGFEYACFESWWGEVRHFDGSYAFPDAEVTGLDNAGLGVVMHASVWLSPAYSRGVPASASTMTPTELANDVESYSKTVLQHYTGKIELYAALNEPCLQQVTSLSLQEMEKVINASARGAKVGDPNVRTFVNIAYPIVAPGNLDSVSYKTAHDMYGNVQKEKQTYDPPTASGFDLLQTLYSKPGPVDITGLEFYYGVVSPPIDLGLFSKILDAYGALGKPVFISELSYATLDDYPGLVKYWSDYGGWHEGYTDEAQADWAKSALSIAFSKPYVIGVQWVAANDGPPNYDFVGDGLFHRGGITPRPSLMAIGDCVAQWTSHAESLADEQGRIDVVGTAGKYEISVRGTDGRDYHATVSLGPSIGSDVTIVCNPDAGS